MATDRLAVSETFYSIQGEGQTMGIPAVFLRLGGCNILCESKNWRCDTIEVWQRSKSLEFEDVLDSTFVDRLAQGAHLVITGGEPLMQQRNVLKYLQWFAVKYLFHPTVEIETNGTILPLQELKDYVHYWNVSPKLSTAGEHNTAKIRINKNALIFFSDEVNSIFKFVVSCENDIDEIYADYYPIIDREKIVLMPARSSREELDKTRQFVAESCVKYKLRYSERLHIVIWNLKTGV